MDLRKLLPQTKEFGSPYPDITSDAEEEKQEVVPHSHSWQLLAKTYVEPKSITVQGHEDINRVLFTGQTTYLFQCSECSEFKKEVMEGLEDTALDRLLDKVELTGPEYIRRGTNVFVLLKNQEASQGQNLPLR